MKHSFTPRLRRKAGLPPGSLVFTGVQKVDRVHIHAFVYDAASCEERDINTLEEFSGLKDRKAVEWINITGLHDVEMIEKVGQLLNINTMVLEDILNTEQRPKVEDLTDALFMVLKMATVDPNTGSIQWEQISLLMRGSRVISIQEYPRDVFESLRIRLREDKGRVRKSGSDYLIYVLIDAIIDHYFLALESLGDRLENMEELVVDQPEPEISHKIYQLKREMIFLRKAVWPLRDIITTIQQLEPAFFHKDTKPYIKDLYDHTIQVMETVEMYRDVLSGLRDTYLSSVSNRMNTIMKVLTIIATIFIPLTFMAGVYGMNFEVMPELKWPWSYPVLWGLMIIVAVIMLLFFRRKRWL